MTRPHHPRRRHRPRDQSTPRAHVHPVGATSERAVAEGRVELKRVIDKRTGETESYGVLVSRARVGRYRLLLTIDRVRQMRWILIDGPEDLRQIGYILSRAEDCQATWDELVAARSERDLFYPRDRD